MDSISTFLVWLSVGLTIQGGHVPIMLFLTTIIGMLLFYMSHWVHYVTGSLRFSKFDVIEIQYIAILTFVVTGVFGHDFWNWNLYGDYNFRDAYFALSCILSFNSAFWYMWQILEVGIIHNRSSVAGTSVLLPGSNIIIISTIAFTVGSKNLLYKKYLILYLIYFGVCAAKITNRLIIAAMTKSEIRLTDPALWSLCIIGLNQYFQCPINEDYVFYGMFGYVVFDLIRFLDRTYHQIAQYLDIGILFVHSKK